ncbi:amine oxidase [Exiguobacterium sp. SH3S2]|uniref:flavin monoamine oxidase family protein n=1 Tax=unclassified Exiguobacterium TaxID=2644629 RepID=UPI001039EFC5|nr:MULTISPECIES: FAD-dependent oxidoreductase [unclassified Exiguobacterium]TCI42883.1 amine oxidase [Exiguobacterium sp. SH3S3]TCI58636.1 amine oxidase [Exiguobacterium sp. SH3S2]
MNRSIAIIGAGVSGLYAASLLIEKGYDVTVFESRDRIGGRVLSQNGFDLGPTWYWPDTEKTITQLVDRLGLRAFPQHTTGDLMLERQAGVIERHTLPPEQTVLSMRLEGGMATLTTALAARLPEGTIELETTVTSIHQTEDGVSVAVEAGSAKTFHHVILAIPPRLVSRISFQPELSEATKVKLSSTPTWMAGQAKVVAVYDRPFWRDAGLSGLGMSWSGVLQEIHDASAPGGYGALFGFFRLSPFERAALDRDELNRLVVEQLVRLFGEEARHPRDVLYVDWSSDRDTASSQDAQPLSDFPVYGPITFDTAWEEKLSLAGTETDSMFGGHIEGALRSAIRVVEQL